MIRCLGLTLQHSNVFASSGLHFGLSMTILEIFFLCKGEYWASFPGIWWDSINYAVRGVRQNFVVLDVVANWPQQILFNVWWSTGCYLRSNGWLLVFDMLEIAMILMFHKEVCLCQGGYLLQVYDGQILFCLVQTGLLGGSDFWWVMRVCKLTGITWTIFCPNPRNCVIWSWDAGGSESWMLVVVVWKQAFQHEALSLI